MEKVDQLKATVESVLNEDGYTGAVNFLYRKGKSRKEAQQWLKDNMNLLDPAAQPLHRTHAMLDVKLTTKKLNWFQRMLQKLW